MGSRELLDLVWIVPALPLLGTAVLLLFGKRIGAPRAGWLATGLMALAFVWSVVMFVTLRSLPADQRAHVVDLWDWFVSGSFSVKLGFLLDPLSTVFLLVVTGVGTLIHLYAIGYLHGDEDFPRFFGFLNLFGASMLVLVLGSSFLVTFLGWEGVGLCSYLLISYWFQRPVAATAGQKAFVTNRVGDFGFMLAMFLIFVELGSLDYGVTLPQAGTLASGTATAIALLLFLGAAGKSAQIPLFVWLPDAMEGPTPVSALIHAATMVTAGVYLVARAHPFVEASGGSAATAIAWIGALTAISAATIGIAQNDIKRVLAYSTVSQLGYMFLALGVGAYVAAIFHVIMHAFFKATLFLGAGSVIRGIDENQDIRTMGGLRKYMPFTAGAFICGWLAISGIPPFSGFWSKDEILEKAFASQHYALWIIGVITAGFTAFYMTREVWLVFHGNERFRVAADPSEVHEHDETVSPTVGADDSPHEAVLRDQPHEAPWVMTLPVLVLAGLAVVGGLVNLPFGGADFLDKWLEPTFATVPAIEGSGTAEVLGLIVVSVLFAAAGIGVGFALYRRGLEDPDRDPLVVRAPAPATLLRHAYYVDDTITAAVGGPIEKGAEILSDDVDTKGIDGAVNGTAWLFLRAGEGLRRVQSGLLRRYAMGIAAGTAALLLYLVAWVVR